MPHLGHISREERQNDRHQRRNVDFRSPYSSGAPVAGLPVAGAPGCRGRGDSCAARPVRCGLPRAPKEVQRVPSGPTTPPPRVQPPSAAEPQGLTDNEMRLVTLKKRAIESVEEMPSAGGQTPGGQDRSTALSLWPLGR